MKPVELETGGWSGDGDLTIQIVEALQAIDGIVAIRVEDAPASRAGIGFNFLANEIYIAFAATRRSVRGRAFGVIPVTRYVDEPVLTLTAVEAQLAANEGIGPADYSDDGMLQYLRSERIVPPYQTRGYKQVEMVRVYQAGAGPVSAGDSRAPG